MADSILDAIEYFQRFPKVAEQAAQLSINTVANRSGMKLIRSSILDEIAFPRDYLTTGDRLKVTKNATPGNLEAVITARERPTSLARFAGGQSLGSRAKIGVKVTVKKGGGTLLKQSWLVRLKNGNIGLAVRLKPGESFENKTGDVRVWLVPDKVALLYGPSVDQVFRQVSRDKAVPIGNMVTQEFLRQFNRIANGN